MARKLNRPRVEGTVGDGADLGPDDTARGDSLAPLSAEFRRGTERAADLPYDARPRVHYDPQPRPVSPTRVEVALFSQVTCGGWTGGPGRTLVPTHILPDVLRIDSTRKAGHQTEKISRYQEVNLGHQG